MKSEGQPVLAQNLIRLRKGMGITQAAISETLGIERSRYAHYEKDTTPSADILRALAAIFRVTIDELMYSPDQLKLLKECNDDYIEGFYFNELKKDEKLLIMKYRLLSEESQNAVQKLADEKLDREDDL